MKKAALIVLTLWLLLLTACQRSDVWWPDFSGEEPVAAVQYKDGGEKDSKRAETSEDIEKLQKLTARIDAYRNRKGRKHVYGLRHRLSF